MDVPRSTDGTPAWKSSNQIMKLHFCMICRYYKSSAVYYLGCSPISVSTFILILHSKTAVLCTIVLSMHVSDLYYNDTVILLKGTLVLWSGVDLSCATDSTGDCQRIGLFDFVVT